VLAVVQAEDGGPELRLIPVRGPRQEHHLRTLFSTQDRRAPAIKRNPTVGPIGRSRHVTASGTSNDDQPLEESSLPVIYEAR
jgi:hypothetical protein